MSRQQQSILSFFPRPKPPASPKPEALAATAPSTAVAPAPALAAARSGQCHTAPSAAVSAKPAKFASSSSSPAAAAAAPANAAAAPGFTHEASTPPAAAPLSSYNALLHSIQAGNFAQAATPNQPSLPVPHTSTPPTASARDLYCRPSSTSSSLPTRAAAASGQQRRRLAVRLTCRCICVPACRACTGFASHVSRSILAVAPNCCQEAQHLAL
jgi:hypothetical protein